MKAGDVMMRDPFDTPREVTRSDALVVAVMSLLATKSTDVVLFASPASMAPNVIGATATGTCEACRCPVWLAPSSRSLADPPRIICLPCITRALARTGAAYWPGANGKA